MLAIDGLAFPAPPPLPRCAMADGNQRTLKAKTTTIAGMTRIPLTLNIVLLQ
jgi:hypothetical protein